jgi:hypothetical protein
MERCSKFFHLLFVSWLEQCRHDMDLNIGVPLAKHQAIEDRGDGLTGVMGDHMKDVWDF